MEQEDNRPRSREIIQILWIAAVVAVVPLTAWLMTQKQPDTTQKPQQAQDPSGFSGGLAVRVNPSTDVVRGDMVTIDLTGGCGCGAYVNIDPSGGLTCTGQTLVINPGCAGVASLGTFDWRWSCTATGAPGTYTLHGVGGNNGVCTASSPYSIVAARGATSAPKR